MVLACAFTGISPSAVARCVEDSGGVGVKGGANSRIETTLAEIDRRSIIKLPEIYVNQIHVRGAVSVATVLGTICNGYLPGTEPPVCACVELDPSEAAACVESDDYSGYGRPGSVSSPMRAARLALACSLANPLARRWVEPIRARLLARSLARRGI